MLHRGLIISLCSLVIIIFAFHDPNAAPKAEDIDFHVHESNALYFRNLRQFYYDKEHNEESQFDIFRFRTRPADSSKADVRFAIVNNWLNDQAYILMEATILAWENDSVRIRVEKPDQRVEYFALGNEGTEEHLRIALTLYKALAEEGSKFYVESSLGDTHLWTNTEERKGVKRSLKDYFKLIGALN